MADNLHVIIGADVKGLQTGVDQSIRSLEKLTTATKPVIAQTNNAGIALTNLGRVAQDLPFGFIAIANNLDPLVQSLGSLSKQSGGVGGALKALGSALAGPAGLALGFSVVTSAVTVAIQKYGSLSAAVSALVGGNGELSQSLAAAAKSYEKYNESARSAQEISTQETAGVQSQIIRAQTLAAIVQDQTRSYKERNAALLTLKEINKDYFGNLKIEKDRITGLTEALALYIRATILTAKAKGFEDALGKTSVELQKQQRLLDQLGKKRDEDVKRLERQIDNTALNEGEQLGVANALAGVSDEYNKQAAVVANLRKESGEYEFILSRLTEQINQVKSATTKTTESTNTGSKANNDAAKGVRAYTAAEAELEAQLLRSIEARKRIPRVSFDVEAAQLSKQQLDAIFPKGEQQKFIDLPKINLNSLFLTTGPNLLQKNLKEATKLATDTAAIFNSTLGPAIDSVFNALGNGENILGALKNAFKQIIVQLAATIVKALVLQAILNAVAPGSGAIAGAVAGGTSRLGQILTNLIGGRTAAPSFRGGGGVMQGGIQLAGQVVFVQRGTDLVGVLNQGNARINRVG